MHFIGSFRKFVLKLRPAPIAALVADILGLARRRLVSTDDGRFFLNPMSNFGTRILEGEYEPIMREVLKRYLPEAGIFIDVGANEGYFSVLASRLVGPKGIVIAIEPQSRLQKIIQSNLMANECFNVRQLQCAVSDKSGKARLLLAPETNTGSSSLFRTSKYPLRTEQVQSFSLAELLEKLGVEHCDLMKVDIEGAEYGVFMAAKDVLESGKLRNIAVEFHHSTMMRYGLSPEVLHEHIISSGYKLHQDSGQWVYSFISSTASSPG